MRRGESNRSSLQGGWHVVKSPILGGQGILILRHPVFARAARRAHPEMVVYSPAEVDVLHQHRSLTDYEALFRAVHLMKKTFDGVVIPSRPAVVQEATKPKGAGATPLAMVTTDDGRGFGSPDGSAREELEK